MKDQKPNLSDKDADDVIEKRLNKIQQAKKKWYEKQNLTDIDPADDGVWQFDVVPTDEELDKIIANIDNPPSELPESPEGASRLKRAASLYFEGNPVVKWSMPIHYWVHDKFSSYEKYAIDSSLSTITSNVGCIKFVKDTTKLSSGSQIQYWKEGTSYCGGTSPVGYKGINYINLNIISWCSGDQLKSVIIHETIHSMGGGHEMSRTDRDKFLTIITKNIDPQQMHNYDMDSESTTYGTEFDFASIMMYEQGTFAISSGMPTFTPKVSTSTISGYYMTPKDILQLKRMYCSSSTCKDQYQACGIWAKQYCTAADWQSWMNQYCPKSCGKCGF